MKLEATVKGGGSPRGRAAVYVCAAKGDRELLPTLAEWVWKSHDVSLWVNVDEAPATEEERADLSEMRLFLLPVTHRALGDGAVMADAAYAAEHRIPLLPLFMEEGLEEEFNRAFGNLQALSPFDRDATAIPFAEKLEKYLSSVLLSDGMAERVRAAFDAYIFLSYRKKDRLLAQKLMRLIHENEFARDIAIWYDEFLVPGEDWSESIEEALAKSRLFALAVTPNLLEEGNFVKSVEYPAACVAGKPIVAAEVAETDREALASAFPDLPAVVKAESDALPEALLSALSGIAVRENDKDPVHNFFIGLAYLSGIDVERRPDRALDLITSSAEAGVPEAMEKLSQMYETGDGAERNYESAALWQERLAAHRRRAWEREKTEDSYFLLHTALWRTGEGWCALSRTERAKEAYLALGRLAKEAEGVIPERDRLRHLSMSHTGLGDVAEEEGDFKEAAACFEKSYGIDRALWEEEKTDSAIRDLSVGCVRLGDLCRETGDSAGADSHYREAHELARELWEKNGTADCLRDLSVCCVRRADFLRERGDREGAEALYLEALEYRRRGGEDTEARRDLSTCLGKLGDLYRAGGELSRAEEYYREALSIARELWESLGSLHALADLSACLDRMGALAAAAGDLDGARRWHEEDLLLSERLLRETDSLTARRNLASCHYRLGQIAQKQGDLQGAFAHFLRDRDLSSAVFEATGTRRDRSILAHAAGRLSRLAKAEERWEEAYAYGKEEDGHLRILAEETGEESRLRERILCLDRLGDLACTLGDTYGAVTYYAEGLELAEGIGYEQAVSVLREKWEELLYGE